jgi:hypothetical protein
MSTHFFSRSGLKIAAAALISCGIVAAGCSRNSPAPQPAPDAGAAQAVSAAPVVAGSDRPPANPERNAYFGDVHVHTGYSFDAFTNGSKTTPQDAYDWAKGKAITGSGLGPDIKIVTPLDFYAVADHAEYMGVFNQMTDPNSQFGQLPIAKRVTSPDGATRMAAFAEVLRDMSAGRSDPQLADPVAARSVWAGIVKTADAN